MRLADLFADAKATLRLATPLIAGQLSQMLMGVVDTAMIGRLGTTPLAAAALVTNLSHVPLVFGIGLLTAIPVRVSQARGASHPEQARAALRSGMWLALVMGLATLCGAAALGPHLRDFGQDAAVVSAAPVFLEWIALSLVPAFLGMAVKNHADAMNHPWPPFWITLGGVLLNVVLNWLLIYGNGGFPALGLAGAGAATLIARVAVFAGIVTWCRSSTALRDWIPVHWFRFPSWRSFASLARLGLPSAMQMLAEVSAFVAAGFLVGTLGAQPLAAHQVALVCAASVFMIPLGLSMAVTVRTGAALGAGERTAPRRILSGALLVAALVTLLTFGAIAGGRHLIASWFVADAVTFELAAGLLLISAVFQTCDAIQVISMGGLRGLEDVNFPARAAFAAHWLIGIPLGWWLAFRQGAGVQGIWWGLTAGLTVCAVLFAGRFWMKTRS